MRAIDADKLPVKGWKKRADMLQDDYTTGAETDWALKVAIAENKMLWEIISSIENAPTLTPPNEWVSVEDRLPDYSDGMVLLTDGNIVQTGYRNWLFRMDWLPGVYCPKQRPSGGEMRVTHWLPLPEPPERKSEDE